MKRFGSDEQRKAAFAKMLGADGYLKKVGKYDSLKEFKGGGSVFAVPPDVMAKFYDPWAIQPQTSFLMMYPELQTGPFNLESRKPRSKLGYGD